MRHQVEAIDNRLQDIFVKKLGGLISTVRVTSITRVNKYLDFLIHYLTNTDIGVTRVTKFMTVS